MKRRVALITISLESAFYIVSIVAIFCGAAYKIGYEMGKTQKNNRLALENLTIIFYSP